MHRPSTDYSKLHEPLQVERMKEPLPRVVQPNLVPRVSLLPFPWSAPGEGKKRDPGNEVAHGLHIPGGGGGIALFGLHGDVPLDRVWFFGLAVLNRVYNLTCLCPKQGMVLRAERL